MRNMKVNRLWTGAETVVASKAGAPFTYSANDYGIVVSKGKNNITVEYNETVESLEVKCGITDLSLLSNLTLSVMKKGYTASISISPEMKGVEVIYNNKTNTFNQIKKVSDVENIVNSLVKKKGKKTTKKYSLRAWSSKIEGGMSIKHEMTTSLSVGSTVTPGQVITYDSGFFEPNIYDKTALTLKMGGLYKVAFVEKKTTYEDSIEMNRAILAETGEVKYGVASKVIEVTAHVTNTLPEGSKVSYGDKLMTIIDSSLISDDSISERSKQILSEADDASPESKYNGIIDRIDVIYNCELDEMDPSVRELADKSNKRFMDERGTTGQVDAQYSIEGKPLLNGEIELKYYITSEADTKAGDKFIIGHQLKNTIGDIRDNIETEDGERVDAIFSTRSTMARIAPSTFINATINTILEDVTKEAIK